MKLGTGMKRKLLCLLMSMALAMGILGVASAEVLPDQFLQSGNLGPGNNTGWLEQEDGSRQYLKDGNTLSQQWLQLSDGFWYYLDAAGRMLRSQWAEPGDGERYYLDQEGHLLYSQWIPEGEAWYYVDADGKMLRSQWVEDADGSRYFVNDTGQMQRSQWFQGEDGYWYYADADGKILSNQKIQAADGYWYYADEAGHMARSQWVQGTDGFMYFADDAGHLLSGWQNIGGETYYLSEQDDTAHPFGACYINEQTPDGSTVDARGVKVVPIQQPQAINRANPYGYSCVEVDITNQMVYCYIGSELKLATACVTGRDGSYSTQVGHHKINSKERNRYLEGYNADGSKYKSWVNYWMPFYNGQGLHDASWRSSFGGSIYHSRGSHGCVNLPPSAAAQLYNIVYVGMPVIVHK